MAKKARIIFLFLCIAALTMQVQFVSYAAETEAVDQELNIPPEDEEEASAGGTEDVIENVESPVETDVVNIAVDNDELFEGYVDRLFYGTSSTKTRKSSVRTRLSENEQVVYDFLKKGIVNLAAGKGKSSIFKIPITDIDGKMYTAKELGLSTILNSSGALSEEAMKAIQEKSYIDVGAVMYALIVDCPYELYWFDKTVGFSWEYPTIKYYPSQQGPAGYQEGQEEEYLTIYMAVAEEYSDGAYTILNGKKVLTSTDVSKTDAAIDASQNAKKIVNENASLSDYEKLIHYKDAICDWTDYNDSAADEDLAYGNPWQLIWVFDGDPDTQVVCEGYTKAFQYLCDLSEFTEDVECITVTGIMNGGTGAGGHMWNIVHMDDGKNYLIDLTNCDQGNIGYPDNLFLKGYNTKSTFEQESYGNAYQTSEYIFKPNARSISYVYDYNTVNMYSEQELSLSQTEYRYVKKETIENASVSGIVNKAYTGQKITQNPVVKLNGETLKEGTDYTISYTNNIGNGTAYVTINGIGGYSGSIKKSFTITPPALRVKSLWASRHDVGKVLFKWTRKDSVNVAGWNVKYRFRKIGGDNSWSGWTTKSYAANTYEAWIPIKTDYVIEIHAQAAGDSTWSTGIITCPAGGTYHAMKTTHVVNAATNKRLVEKSVSGSAIAHTAINLKVGQTLKVKPDCDYDPNIKDFTKRPKLYPQHLLYDISDNSMITITKPDGSNYTGGIIDGVATIKATKKGKTTIIFRSPNGRTMIGDVTVN